MSLIFRNIFITKALDYTPQLLRFHVSFCLSHILVYLLYYYPSLNISKINKYTTMWLKQKGTWTRDKCVL